MQNETVLKSDKTIENLAVSTGCGCMVLSTAIWLALVGLVVAALWKFVTS